MEVRSENVVYQAVRRWWLRSPFSPLQILGAERQQQQQASCAGGGGGNEDKQPVAAGTQHEHKRDSFCGAAAAAADGLIKSAAAPRSVSLHPLTQRVCDTYQVGLMALWNGLRLPMMTIDFLLDVVKWDDGWWLDPLRPAAGPDAKRAVLAVAVASPAPGDGKVSVATRAALVSSSSSSAFGLASSLVHTMTSVLAERVHEAIAFHACSGKRKQIHSGAAKLLFLKRVGSARSASVTMSWRIERVKEMFEGRYIFSNSFFVDGYWMRLQVRLQVIFPISFGSSAFAK